MNFYLYMHNNIIFKGSEQKRCDMKKKYQEKHIKEPGQRKTHKRTQLQENT